MPATSRKQFRFFQMLAHNKERAKEVGMSPTKASEYVSKNTGKMSYAKLPESKDKYKRTKKMLKK